MRRTLYLEHYDVRHTSRFDLPAKGTHFCDLVSASRFLLKCGEGDQHSFITPYPHGIGQREKTSKIGIYGVRTSIRETHS